MAEIKKTAAKPAHPSFSRMVCESMHSLDANMKGGHSMQALRKYMGEKYKLANGWEKRLNSTIKMMLHKKQLAHAAGHHGSFRLSKSMAAREEKRLKRATKAAMAKAAPMKKAAPKRKAAKIGPAKRAKKAAPKKGPAKKKA